MYLYRFEVLLKEEAVPVVVVAGDDDQAFCLVDTELEKTYLKMPEVEDVTLYEKKRIQKGGGFVLRESENL
ncbi:uncharacterized protein DUF3906 [Melghirimyces profundicolus]|uniref:Uncharacterized protein DUF3906 n=1 Tax=Melghirimyces profundicolus TaxID=1242148 RepID=A0A2T6C4I6_9BACL|nr:DUF3906 family protein [Melghirimyces profundicolus]PTX63241.1 uncharacterized protein DUF3906 [Melghirimyces profundicolus]